MKTLLKTIYIFLLVSVLTFLFSGCRHLSIRQSENCTKGVKGYLPKAVLVLSLQDNQIINNHGITNKKDLKYSIIQIPDKKTSYCIVDSVALNTSESDENLIKWSGDLDFSLTFENGYIKTINSKAVDKGTQILGDLGKAIISAIPGVGFTSNIDSIKKDGKKLKEPQLYFFDIIYDGNSYKFKQIFNENKNNEDINTIIEKYFN